MLPTRRTRRMATDIRLTPSASVVTTGSWWLIPVRSLPLPLSPHQSEYMSLGRLARAMLYWRQFAAGLGYPQPEPLKLHSDSTTAMALTTAPAISRNSRHIAQYAHLLRHLYQTGEMVPAYLGTHEIIPNGLTKTLGPTDYIYHEHQLFGDSLFRS